MDKEAREKLIILTIILLLLPCLFYQKDDTKMSDANVFKEHKYAQHQEEVNNFSTTTIQQSRPISTANDGKNNTRYDKNNFDPVVQNYAEQNVYTPTNYNNVNYYTTPSISATDPVQDDALDGVDFLVTDNYANHKLKYHYYIPKSLLKNKNISYPLIVLVPGLSDDADSLLLPEFKDFAKKEGFGIVAPTFVSDEANYKTKTSYIFPSGWSGDAMIRIVNALESKGVKSSKLYMFGFSAGAEFVSTFSFIHPEMVAACAVNGNGGRAVPKSNNGVKYFISVGSQDLPIRIKYAEAFYKSAKRLKIPAEYKQYNEAHLYCEEQILDALNFFKRVKNDSF